MAIRIALGAGRGRLIRQLMTESVALAVAGGLLGLLLTMWGIDLLPAVLEARVPRADGIRIDATVLAFSMGATLLTGLLFGLAPALQTATAPSGSLKESGRGTTASSRGRRLRSAIVVAETALAVVVLVGRRPPRSQLPHADGAGRRFHARRISCRSTCSSSRCPTTPRARRRRRC